MNGEVSTGRLAVGRRAFEGIGTWDRDESGAWIRIPRPGRFPLLEATSQLGAPSASLTTSWQTTRRTLVELIDAGLVR